MAHGKPTKLKILKLRTAANKREQWQVNQLERQAQIVRGRHAKISLQIGHDLYTATRSQLL